MTPDDAQDRGGTDPKAYVMAARRGGGVAPPPDWAEQLRRIPGVSEVTATAAGASFRATAEAAGRVRDVLGAAFHVEERAERGPASGG